MINKNIKPLNSNCVGKNIWDNINIWKGKNVLIKNNSLRNGKFTKENYSPDDIGDYLPGILWWGLDKKEIREWVEGYIRLWDNKYKTDI